LTFQVLARALRSALRYFARLLGFALLIRLIRP
jgi:hypothetical protein